MLQAGFCRSIYDDICYNTIGTPWFSDSYSNKKLSKTSNLGAKMNKKTIPKFKKCLLDYSKSHGININK